ncbi:MAG: flagellar hook-length control protein FliK, partial [Rubrivivax sp.]
SQRLGEALAQRVIAQVERGNWEIRLLLRPARLGEVEVDLSLRSGALDAAFRATNPVTRDLLNDGLPRLREVLAGAGMDIAGLNVGNGRSQHTGDNPTPRHARAPQGDEGADRSVTAAAAPASTPRLRGAGESGWDVLV